MKKFLTVIGLFCFSQNISFAQTPLFTVISESESTLTPAELDKLDTLRDNPVYDSIWFIEVQDVYAVQLDGMLTVTIPGEGAQTAHVSKYEPSSELSNPEEYKWDGTFKGWDPINSYDAYDGSIRLIKKDGGIFGYINPFNSDNIYEIASFGPGKNILIKHNVEGEISECGEDLGEEDNMERVTGPCNSTIRVLVTYTTAAEKSVSSINNAATQAISDLNGAVYNSKASGSIDFVLVGTQWTSFDESQYSNETDLRNAIAANSVIQYNRNAATADIVICLVDRNLKKDWNTAIVGNAFIGLQPNNAYAFVEADNCNTQYAFSHEVGHVMGGRHQQSSIFADEADDTQSGINHGYSFKRTGFLSGGKRYFSIMHYNYGGNRQHYFSNPDVTIWSKPFGTSTDNNMAQLLRDNACTAAEFRSDNIVYFNAFLTGPSVATTGQTVTIYGNPVNGISPYQFKWWYSTDGGANYSLLTTTNGPGSTSINFTMPHVAQVLFYVSATTAVAPEYKILYKTIYNNSAPFNNPVSCCPSGTKMNNQSSEINNSTNSFDLNIYPVPATENLVTIDMEVPKEKFIGNETLVITDMVGKVVKEVKLSEYKQSVQIDDLFPGMYFARLHCESPIVKNFIVTK